MKTLAFRRLIIALGLGASWMLPTSAFAQINIGPPGGDPDDGQGSVCIAANGDLTVSLLGDDCGDFVRDVIDPLRIGPSATQIVLNASDGQATFGNTATFNGTTNLNGQTNINGPLSLAGSITASGVTSTGGLTNTGSFTNNGSATVTNGLTAGSVTTGGQVSAGSVTTTGGVTATGTISGGNLFTAGNATVQGFFNAQNGASILGTTQLATVQVFQGITVSNGATINAGNNRIQNVALPTAGTDAANKNYVDGQVSTIQVGLNQATVDNLRQDTELAGIRGVNTRQDAELVSVRTDNTRQDTELTAVRAVNTQQASQISAIQALDVQQGQQISALQSGQAALFDLANRNRRDIGTANEGVAMALAMESPALPPGTNFALSGGIGYFQNRTAATTAITARVADRASVSAGVGVGFKSGEVGARSGFQIAW